MVRLLGPVGDVCSKSALAAACAATIGLATATAAAQPARRYPESPFAPGSPEDPYQTVSLPYIRIMGGPFCDLRPGRPPLTGGVVELDAGWRWAATRRLLVSFEGGYSGEVAPTGQRHLGSAGVGVGVYLGRRFSIGWMPSFVLGKAPGGLAVGVRNSIVAPIAYHILVIEAGHQWLSIDGRGQHSLRALAGIDAGALLLLGFTGDHPEHLEEEPR